MDALLSAQDGLFYATFPAAAEARYDPAHYDTIQAAHLMQYAAARLASGNEHPQLGFGAGGCAYPDEPWWSQSRIRAQNPPQQQQCPVSDNTEPLLSLSLPVASPLETHPRFTPFTDSLQSQSPPPSPVSTGWSLSPVPSVTSSSRVPTSRRSSRTSPAKTARRASASATSPMSATDPGKPSGSGRQCKSVTRQKDKNGNKDRKPPLACLFCRGRKIACGPPIPSQDACNQCQRRGLTCKYPIENRRGMRRTGTAPESKANVEKAGSGSCSESASGAGIAEVEDAHMDDDNDQKQQRTSKARRRNPDREEDVIVVKREDGEEHEHDNAGVDEKHDLHDLLGLNIPMPMPMPMDIPFVDKPEPSNSPFYLTVVPDPHLALESSSAHV
uniref:Zn(2)-C6 fungal-type domain-containing protein n=1 Tax=Mycena chlorophos TaxID=658473 RepID=A0ABQ0LN20_MYCCL|nr:predicted protein [Mycena chlorophos]